MIIFIIFTVLFAVAAFLCFYAAVALEDFLTQGEYTSCIVCGFFCVLVAFILIIAIFKLF